MGGKSCPTTYVFEVVEKPQDVIEVPIWRAPYEIHARALTLVDVLKKWNTYIFFDLITHYYGQNHGLNDVLFPK